VTSIVHISEILGISLQMVLNYLKFPERQIIRKIEREDLLTLEESKLLLGICSIVKEVEVIVSLPMHLPFFNAGRWLGDWMQEAVPALGDALPNTYLSTAEGQTIVKSLLVCAASGAYR
jgi:hypothetical protein